MKKLVLISSFCNSPEKIKILNCNLEILKKMDVTIVLHSPLFLEKEIVEKVDFFIFEKNLEGGGETILFWNYQNIGDKSYYFERNWTKPYQKSLSQLRSLLEFSESKESFDLYYFLMYDVLLTEDLVDFMKNNDTSGYFKFLPGYYPEEKPGPFSTQFYCLRKREIPELKKFISSNLCLDGKSIEENFFEFAEGMGIPYINHIDVRDHIYTFCEMEKNFFNFSPFFEFKFFLMKNYNQNRIIFFDVKDKPEIFIRINDGIKKIILWDSLEIEIPENCFSFEIFYKGNSFDIINCFNNYQGGGWKINE